MFDLHYACYYSDVRDVICPKLSGSLSSPGFRVLKKKEKDDLIEYQENGCVVYRVLIFTRLPNDSGSAVMELLWRFVYKGKRERK